MTPRSAFPCAAVVALLALPAAAAADEPSIVSSPDLGAAAAVGGGMDADAPTPRTAGGADPTTVPANVPRARRHRGPGRRRDVAPAPQPAAPAPQPTAPSVPAPATPAPAPAPPDSGLLVPVPSARRTVPGRVARVRTDGRAAIPRSAPKAVKQAIAAANLIVGKPYKWGGGHARLVDSGYDCSGSVGYALIRSGLLGGTMTSGMLARWASAGEGRWIAVYANRSHVYMEIAGLRLDTSGVGDPSGRSGVRWRPVIGRRTGFHARHPVGL